MGQARRIYDLELEQDDAHQRREWHAQRAGRAAVVLFVLTALAGLFGRGGVAETTASAPDLRLRYERFIRWQCETTLLLTPLRPSPDEPFEVSLNADYARDMVITAITPAPVETLLAEDRYVMRFRVVKPGAPIAISAIPLKPGRVPVVIRTAEGQELRAWQLIWP